MTSMLFTYLGDLATTHPGWVIGIAVAVFGFVYFTRLISKLIKILVAMALLGALIFVGWGILFTQSTTGPPDSTEVRNEESHSPDREQEREREEYRDALGR